MNNSLNLLSESLDLKIAVLKEIEAYNDKQRLAFEGEQPDVEQFDEAIEEKGRLIEKLESLDSGFASLYEKLAEELNNNRQKYAVQIRELQKKIAIITDLSMAIQASEARNKKLIEQYFGEERRKIKQGRVGSKVAYDYYKSMSGVGVREAQFLDKKN